MEVVHCVYRNYRPFWLLWPWPRPDDRSYTNLTRILWRHTGCAKMNVCAVESYRIKGSECVHLVTRGHFRSRDKDGGHTIRSAVVKNPMLHANLMARVIEPELWAIEVYTAGIGIFDVFGDCDLDLDPMTFIYELGPSCLGYIGCANMNLLRQGFRKLSSDRETNRRSESTKVTRLPRRILCASLWSSWSPASAICQTSSTISSTSSPRHLRDPCFFCSRTNSLEFTARLSEGSSCRLRTI